MVNCVMDLLGIGVLNVRGGEHDTLPARLINSKMNGIRKLHHRNHLPHHNRRCNQFNNNHIILPNAPQAILLLLSRLMGPHLQLLVICKTMLNSHRHLSRVNLHQDTLRISSNVDRNLINTDLLCTLGTNLNLLSIMVIRLPMADLFKEHHHRMLT